MRRTSRIGPASCRPGAARCRRIVAGLALITPLLPAPVVRATPIPAGNVLRVHVADAFGGKTVIGQLTVADADRAGHVTAFGCDDGPPTDGTGTISRSDLNYMGDVAPNWSNRLIVQADSDGDVCFLTLTAVEIVVDVNAVSFDTGITSFPNRRTDTRTGTPSKRRANGTLRIHVPEAVDGKTVIGQLTAADATDPGHVTAYPCDDGLPTDTDGATDRSDLNYFGDLAPNWSNRLIVQADDDGDICLTPLTSVHLVVDINGVSDTGIFSFPNQRTDTRTDDVEAESFGTHSFDGVPVWPTYTTAPPLDGVAALTGRAAGAAVTRRPIVAVKVDNYRLARPQIGLDRADAVVEVEAEGVSRFMALFHSDVPDVIGPTRSARTADLDLLTAMNRPVFAYSGANAGVETWIDSAAASRLLVDLSAQTNGCYGRDPDRPGPHDLLLDAPCALADGAGAGPARALWASDADWVPSSPPEGGTTADDEFTVDMPGVDVAWSWDRSSDRYLRWQDGEPHLAEPDVQISASNVVEIEVEYIPSPVDARSPHAITTGSGTAVIHRDGRAVPAVWTRSTGYDAFTFTDIDGEEVPLDVGTTWIELVRTG